MKKLLIIVMACYGLNARAQVDESKDFLYLYSDSVVFAKKVTLRTDFFDSWQLRADSKRVPTAQVKFFNNKDGFFANTRKLTFGRESEFTERIIEGRINLFQEWTYDPLSYDRRSIYRARRAQQIDFRMYYNKGYDDLKNVSYTNLKADMSDNKESMNLLSSYRKSINASRAMYIAGGASLVAGIVSLLVATSSNGDMSGRDHFGSQGPGLKDVNFTPGFVLFGIGAGFVLGGFAVQSSSSRHLENAVDAYNR